MKPTGEHSPEDLSGAAVTGGCAEGLTWVASVLRKGLTQVYAVQFAECFAPKHHLRLVERFRQSNLDSAQIVQLEATLHAWEQADSLTRSRIMELLAPIIFEGVDRVLEQAQAAGRDRTGVHLAAARFGHVVVILADPDPHQAWLLPTTQTRLREALAELGFYPTAAGTQELDLAQGDTLQLLGHEFRLSAERHGGWSVQCQPMPPTSRGQPAPEALSEGQAPPAVPDAATANRPPGRRPATPSRVPSPKEHHDEPEAEESEANAGAPGRSQAHPHEGPPPAGAPHPQRRRQSTRLGRGLALLKELVYRARSLEVGWRHLPITLYPVLGLLAGWNSVLAWLCLVVIVAGNRRRLPALAVFVWRHRLEAVLAACGIGIIVSLGIVASDFYGQLSHEVAAPNTPPGFYRGQYNISWNDDPVPYGLYVPPHFAQERGPFPLIVFLHGLGVNGPNDVFARGLAESIIRRFGSDGPSGRFEFIAFFPYNPTPSWAPQSEPVERILRALDHVIRRHRVDPARCYLTGVSNGASGVWQLAQAFPERWAAVAPVASFMHPDIAKVRQLPAWIVHGAQDRQAPVERVRALVQKLQEAHAAVRYVEIPEGGHLLARAAYDNKELYEWLAQQARK